MTVVSNACKSTPALFGPHIHRGQTVCLHSLLPKHLGVKECTPVPHVTWGSNSTPTLFGLNVILGPKSVPLHYLFPMLRGGQIAHLHYLVPMLYGDQRVYPYTICSPYTWGMKCKQCKFIYTQPNMESQPRFK